MRTIEIFEEVYETYTQMMALRCENLYQPLYGVLCEICEIKTYKHLTVAEIEHVHWKMYELRRLGAELDAKYLKK